VPGGSQYAKQVRDGSLRAESGPHESRRAESEPAGSLHEESAQDDFPTAESGPHESPHAESEPHGSLREERVLDGFRGEEWMPSGSQHGSRWAAELAGSQRGSPLGATLLLDDLQRDSPRVELSARYELPFANGFLSDGWSPGAQRNGFQQSCLQELPHEQLDGPQSEPRSCCACAPLDGCQHGR